MKLWYKLGVLDFIFSQFDAKRLNQGINNSHKIRNLIDWKEQDIYTCTGKTCNIETRLIQTHQTNMYNSTQ